MNAEERTELLVRYRQGAEEVRSALHGITEVELDAHLPGEWSARQVAHHLADAETRAYTRLRQLLAEDSPVIHGYDENKYAEMLHYERPVESSLAILDAVRAASAELLDHLREPEWSRAGTHTESGPYSVERWLRIYADHAHDHADQIRRARQTPTS